MTLLERLSQAKQGSRVLDAEIAVSLRWLSAASGQCVPEWADRNFAEWRASADGRVVCVHSDGSYGLHWDAPPFSTSIDAALTLVPELVSIEIWTGTQKAPTPSWEYPVIEARSNSTDALIWKGQAKTLPLALCIAALRAREGEGR